MKANYNCQLMPDIPLYKLTFETDNREMLSIVESACRQAMDTIEMYRVGKCIKEKEEC